MKNKFAKYHYKNTDGESYYSCGMHADKLNSLNLRFYDDADKDIFPCSFCNSPSPPWEGKSITLKFTLK